MSHRQHIKTRGRKVTQRFQQACRSPEILGGGQNGRVIRTTSRVIVLVLPIKCVVGSPEILTLCSCVAFNDMLE